MGNCNGINNGEFTVFGKIELIPAFGSLYGVKEQIYLIDFTIFLVITKL